MALTNLAENNAPIPTRDDETEFVFLVSNNCQVGVHNTHLFALNLRSLAFTTSVLCMRDVLSVVPTYRCKAIVSSGRGCRRLRTKSSILMSSRDWYSRLASVQIAGQSVSQLGAHVSHSLVWSFQKSHRPYRWSLSGHLVDNRDI